jgi:hypothetical protein
VPVRCWTEPSRRRRARGRLEALLLRSLAGPEARASLVRFCDEQEGPFRPTTARGQGDVDEVDIAVQIIKPTFATWALPGHTDIFNPVDSIVASVRYANHTYGSFDNIAYTKQGY